MLDLKPGARARGFEPVANEVRFRIAQGDEIVVVVKILGAAHRLGLFLKIGAARSAVQIVEDAVFPEVVGVAGGNRVGCDIVPSLIDAIAEGVLAGDGATGSIGVGRGGVLTARGVAKSRKV